MPSASKALAGIPDQPSASAALADIPDEPTSGNPSTFNYLFSKDVPGGGNADILGTIARVGGKVNLAIQNAADYSAEKLGQAGVPPKLAAIPGTVLGTASEFLVPQTRFGVGTMAAQGVAKGLGLAGEGLAAVGTTGNKPGAIAQLGQAMTRVRPAETQYFLEHPEEILNAPSIQEATAGYKNEIGALSGKVESIAARLNKTVIRPTDIDAAIDRAGRLINGTELDKAGNAIPITPQDALEGIQSINQAMRDKEYTRALSPEASAQIQDVKGKLMDYMQSNGTPNLRARATDIFRAHVKEDFSNWFPKNKYGSTDALRTWLTASVTTGALGHAASGAAQGNIMPALLEGGAAALTGAAISPKMWGSAIANFYKFAQPATQAGLGLAGRGANNYLQQK